MNPVKEMREKKNLKVTHLAQLLGVTRQTFYNWESRKTIPSLKQMEELGSILNIPLLTIFKYYKEA